MFDLFSRPGGLALVGGGSSSGTACPHSFPLAILVSVVMFAGESRQWPGIEAEPSYLGESSPHPDSGLGRCRSSRRSSARCPLAVSYSEYGRLNPAPHEKRQSVFFSLPAEWICRTLGGRLTSQAITSSYEKLRI